MAFQALGRLFISRKYIEYCKSGKGKPFSYEIENNGYKLGLLDLGDKLGKTNKALRSTANTIKSILPKIRAFQFHDTTDIARIRGGIFLADCQYLKMMAGT